MNKVFKTTLAVATIVAGMGAYKAHNTYMATNMSEEDLLLAENVEALSANGETSENDDPRYKKNSALSSGKCGWKTEQYTCVFEVGNSSNTISMDLAKTAGGAWCLLNGSTTFEMPGVMVSYKSKGNYTIVTGDWKVCEFSIGSLFLDEKCDRCQQKLCTDNSPGAYCNSDLNKPTDAL